MEPKYPHINVQMAGQDGNAFSILGRVRSALRRERVPAEEISRFCDEAMSGDYDHLLATVMAWVDVDGDDDND